MNPIWIARLLVVAAVLGGLAWAHHHIYQQGWDARDMIAKQEIQKANAKAAAELAEANNRVRALNLSISRNLDSINTTHYQESKRAETQVSSLRAQLRGSQLRLSVSLAAGSCPQTGASTSTGAPTGAGAETRADLSPEASEFFVEFAGQCDKSARQLNAVIDAYNAVKDAANAP